jgi:hypothetical protein
VLLLSTWAHHPNVAPLGSLYAKHVIRYDCDELIVALWSAFPRMYCMHSTKAPCGSFGLHGDSVWDEIVVADQRGALGQRPGKGGIDSTSKSSCPVGHDTR